MSNAKSILNKVSKIVEAIEQTPLSKPTTAGEYLETVSAYFELYDLAIRILNYAQKLIAQNPTIEDISDIEPHLTELRTKLESLTKLAEGGKQHDPATHQRPS